MKRAAQRGDDPREPQRGSRDSIARLPTAPRNETRMDEVNALLPQPGGSRTGQSSHSERLGG